MASKRASDVADKDVWIDAVFANCGDIMHVVSSDGCQKRMDLAGQPPAGSTRRGPAAGTPILELRANLSPIRAAYGRMASCCAKSPASAPP